MERLDLVPSEENILKCLSDNLGLRREDIKRFIALLDKVEPPFAICIDAPWGDGKTIFVKTLQMILEARNPNIDKRDLSELPDWVLDEDSMTTEADAFVPFYFNAWLNDMLHNPLGSIIASLTADSEIDFCMTDESFLKKAAAIIDSIGGVMGHDPNLSQLAASGEKLIDEYRARRSLEENIVAYVAEVLREKGDKMVLFIDELDRCWPEYAIRLLGDIKNLLENDKVIIVYSADLNQLANSLNGFYGAGFSTWKYLERFYDRRFEMTPVVSEHYFNGTAAPMHYNDWFDAIVAELLCGFPETMRDINRMKLSLLDAKKFVAKCQNSGDHSIVFANVGLLPVLVFLSHLFPVDWREVRMGQSFESVFRIGKRSPAFMKLLDNTVSGVYGSNYEINDVLRAEYLESLCALIFLDDASQDARRRVAYDTIGQHLWGSIDSVTFRTLDFAKNL